MILIVVFITVLLLHLLWRFLCNRNLPPGPIGLPYFGYSLFIKSPLFKSLNDLGKIHGKLFSFTAFGRTVIVIQDYATIKSVLSNRKEFSGRTTLFITGTLADNGGISNYDGQLVEIKKRFISKFLRMTDDTESIVDSESIYLLDNIQQFLGKPMYSRLFFNKAVCNIIWKLAFGTRFDYSNKNSLSNAEKVSINNSRNEIISFKQFLPLIYSSIVRKFSLFQKLLDLTDSFNYYDNIMDFIKVAIFTSRDLYDDERYPFEIERENSQISLTEKEEQRLLFELYAAGTDTIIITLQWSMLLLSICQVEQEKMRKEIKQLIIPDTTGKFIVSWSDRNKLRYCQQVIAEIHRYSSVTPLALPHRVVKSCVLQGYDIPKDAVVLIGIYSVHNDPDLWDEPHLFKPERFDNKSLTENLIPFSIGSRSCPGSILAQAEIFTLLLNVVVNLYIKPAKNNLSLTDLGIGTSGLTRSPNYHEVIFNHAL